MVILYFDTHEASYAATHPKRMVVVRPLKGQPPEEYEFTKIYHDVALFSCISSEETWCHTLCYPVDVESLVGKETYSYDSINETYRYKADGDEPTWSGWYAPVTMPKEAVRFWIKVVENRIDKVCRLTVDELYITGIVSKLNSCDLYNHVTKKYGKDVWGRYAEIITLEVVGARSGVYGGTL